MSLLMGFIFESQRKNEKSYCSFHLGDTLTSAKSFSTSQDIILGLFIRSSFNQKKRTSVLKSLKEIFTHIQVVFVVRLILMMLDIVKINSHAL